MYQDYCWASNYTNCLWSRILNLLHISTNLKIPVFPILSNAFFLVLEMEEEKYKYFSNQYQSWDSSYFLWCFSCFHLKNKWLWQWSREIMNKRISEDHRGKQCFKIYKALPPSWSGSRVQWHWPVHQTVYEAVHFAAGERVLPSGLDPFWEPAAAPTVKSNSVCSLDTQRHMYRKCRNCHKGGRSGCLHWIQTVI